MRKNLIILAGVLVMMCLSFLAGKKEGVQQTRKWYADHTDTTTVSQIDTNKAEKPVADTEYVDRPVPYPVYIKGDTEYVTEYKDSIVYVMLPRTVKEYRKEKYYAKISGVDPSLDYIETYNETITNTIYVPQKQTLPKNFIELDGKFLYDGMPMAPVTANIGHRFGLFEVYVGSGYDLLLHQPIGQAGVRAQFRW